MNSAVFRFLSVLGISLLALSVTAAQAQTRTSRKKKHQTHPQFADILEDDAIEALLKQRAQSLALKMNLDSETEEQIRVALEERWGPFLQDHRDEIEPLISRLYSTSIESGGSVEEAKAWSRDALDLYDKVMTELDKSDQDVAKILGPEKANQFRMDAATWRLGLGMLRGQLAKWEAGDLSDSPWAEQDLTPTTPDKPATPTDLRRERQKRAQQVAKKTQTTPELTFLTVSAWDQYVIDFIANFDLDEAQKATANAILADIKNRAQQYVKKYTEALDKSRAKLQAAKPKERQQIMKDQKDLLQPLQDLFAELQTRLDALPTEAQRAKAKAARPAKPIKPKGKSKAGQPAPQSKQNDD